MKIEEIKKLIINNGGCSLDYNLNSIEYKKGYMVSYAKFESVVNNIDDTLDKIKEYKKKIENKKGLFIGVWFDDNKYYIDISKHFIDRVDALEFGKYQKQMAIYDLENQKSIYLKDYKFIKFYSIYNRKYELLNQYEDVEEVKKYINDNIKEYNKKIRYINKINEGNKWERLREYKKIGIKVIQNQVNKNIPIRNKYYVHYDYILSNEF